LTAGPRRRGVVLCVDDFGLRLGIDAAAIDLARQGLVTAISCMAGAPRWQRAARALQGLDPTALDVGLHLDFTEAPLDPGLRHGLGSFIRRAYLGRLDANRVAAEIRAQLDAFEAALGRPPAHVDGHQHVHQLPLVREALVSELARRGFTRTWLRGTRPAPGAPPKARVIAALGGARLRALAQGQGLRTSGRLLGVYGFGADAAGYRTRLARWLGQATDGDVLMCHPAVDAADLCDDAIADARCMEYEVIARELPRLLQAHGCRLVPFGR
jgi:predicted glycoside hydrolase/deacetylase ChbG (UPF0249 family)